MRDALGRTRTTGSASQAAVAAYFDFVAGDGQAYRLVFGSDLRGEPEAAAVVEGALTRCMDAVAAAVTTDAGLDPPRARLLAVGLVGLSQVAAQYWLDSDRRVPRDEAVALMAGLAWRGLAGFPAGPRRPTGVATAVRSERGPTAIKRESVRTDGEPDPALGGCDLHVGDLVGPDQVPPALLVDQPEQAVPAGQRRVDQRLDLVRLLVAGHHELPRALRDADLDLHRSNLLVVT